MLNNRVAFGFTYFLNVFATIRMENYMFSLNKQIKCNFTNNFNK